MGNKRLDSIFSKRTTTINFNGHKIEVRKISFREAKDLENLRKENESVLQEGANADVMDQLGFIAKVLGTLIESFEGVKAEDLVDYPIADLNELVNSALEAAMGNKAPLTKG